ncbi:MAG TPA: DoxX family membrane protein [Pyrinomonadaceae bacterium]|nr:DoxX family membrane protein [Pyrinomonadaceae bacterium]
MKYILDNLPMIFAALFTAILFTQSGLDKVFNYKGNVEWLTGHFEKSILRGQVPFMLPVITLLEIVAGVGAAIGLVYFLATGVTTILWYAAIVGAAALTALFFGQRVAQDYPGAAVLVPYFILQLILMYLSKPASV